MTPREPKTERDCSHRQLFRYYCRSSVWRNKTGVAKTRVRVTPRVRVRVRVRVGVRVRVRSFGDFPTFFSDFPTRRWFPYIFRWFPYMFRWFPYSSVISLLRVNSVSVISLPLFFNVLEVFCFARKIILMGVRLLLSILQLWGGQWADLKNFF